MSRSYSIVIYSQSGRKVCSPSPRHQRAGGCTPARNSSRFSPRSSHSPAASLPQGIKTVINILQGRGDDGERRSDVAACWVGGTGQHRPGGSGDAEIRKSYTPGMYIVNNWRIKYHFFPTSRLLKDFLQRNNSSVTQT